MQSSLLETWNFAAKGISFVVRWYATADAAGPDGIGLSKYVFLDTLIADVLVRKFQYLHITKIHYRFHKRQKLDPITSQTIKINILQSI
jgi:hypothetical protein